MGVRAADGAEVKIRVGHADALVMAENRTSVPDFPRLIVAGIAVWFVGVVIGGYGLSVEVDQFDRSDTRDSLIIFGALLAAAGLISALTGLWHLLTSVREHLKRSRQDA